MQNDLLLKKAQEISKHYKISAEDAYIRLTEHLNKNMELKSLLETENDSAKIEKTRIFKEFLKRAKKDIYFSLRTYQRNVEDLSDASHISTLERKPELNIFFEQINDYLTSCERIIDIGGGMLPASFPFEKYENIKEYVWIDKDITSYNKLMEIKKNQNLTTLNLVCKNLSEIEWFEFGNFDLALMLKLVPVISRQEKNLLKKLTEIPAKIVILTGSKEAMVKKENIQHREDKLLKSFIELSGRKIIKRIEISNEFGYVV